MSCSRILKALPNYDWEHEDEDDAKDTTTANGGLMGDTMERPLSTKKGKRSKAKQKTDSSLDSTESTA
jgi:hypothetical protein